MGDGGPYCMGLTLDGVDGRPPALGSLPPNPWVYRTVRARAVPFEWFRGIEDHVNGLAHDRMAFHRI